MKSLSEIALAFALIIILHILAAVLSTTVQQLLTGIVCYLWAAWIIEGRK